jgi:hypothetical protein
MAEMVSIVGAATAPGGITTDGPPFKLKVPPFGPITALLLGRALPPPTQMPAWQEALPAPPSPLVQAVPSDFGGFEHAPVAGLQVPTSWHWSEAAHMTVAQFWPSPPSS